MAQPSECFVPSLPHATEGQLGVSSGAMHEPPQMELPTPPFQSEHGTSWYVPSIAPSPLGKKAFAAPESSHRSKLRLVLFSAHHGSSNEKKKNALHGHVVRVERLGDSLVAPSYGAS